MGRGQETLREVEVQNWPGSKGDVRYPRAEAEKMDR
jgi:hypothetical protein